MTKTILLVDDDVDVLETTQYLLLRQNYNVITAKDGEEAILKYKTTKPDIVFMDIKMPKLNGYEAFFKIKKFDTHAKIVFISAYALDNEQIQNAKKNNLVGIVDKPFDLKDLIKFIENT